MTNIPFEFSRLCSFTFLNWVPSGFGVRVLLGTTGIHGEDLYLAEFRDTATLALGFLCGVVFSNKFNLSDTELQGFWYFCWFW